MKISFKPSIDQYRALMLDAIRARFLGEEAREDTLNYEMARMWDVLATDEREQANEYAQFLAESYLDDDGEVVRSPISVSSITLRMTPAGFNGPMAQFQMSSAASRFA
jgi:hypothetical protein